MHRSEISLANYPVRLLLFRSKRIESGFGFILIECPCPKNYFIIFQGCFTVQLSRFFFISFSTHSYCSLTVHYFIISSCICQALFSNFFFGTAVEESFCRLHPQKMKNTSVKMFQNVRFVSESGCKGKDFFITSKLFKRKVLKFFFQNPTRAISWRTLHNIKTCKPTHHTLSPPPFVQYIGSWLRLQR